MFALVSNEELESQGQIMIKQLKNRYNDTAAHKRFVVGIDRSRMKIFDVAESQQNLVQDVPVFDNSTAQEKFNNFKME
jgi:hypothetical protein